MNNQFLSHLKSITPQGMAEEKKMFIPASKFEAKPTKKINMAPPLPAVDEAEELDEATRSKYLKKYMKHKVGTDTTELDIADAKRNAAVLRRGGADADTIRKGSFTGKTPMSHYNDANMARYRFANKAADSAMSGKKSPRKAAVSEANVSKADKVYRKFGHGTEHDLAQLKRQVGVLRRGGASDETIRKFPKIAAKGGSHNQAEITTARANFMAGGARKRRLGIKSPRKTDVSEGMELDEGLLRKQRLLRARTSGKTRTPEQRKALDTAYDSELGRRVARKLRHGGATKATMRSFINTDKPTTAAADRAFKKYNEAEWKKHQQLLAKGVHPKRLGFAESTEISEGSMSSQRIRRKWKSGNLKGNVDRSVLDKMSALANRRALRGGASPEDVKNRMNDPKANVRSYNGLLNFHDTMRTKGGNKRRIAEGSSGMKKGIRMTHAVMVKGHTDIGMRADAAELRAISKINKEAGGTGRITKKPRNYKFSDKEFEVMQGHAKKGLAGKNRSNAVRAVKLRGASGRPDMNESIKKQYKKTKKTAKRVLKQLRKALSTPRDAVDVMITGRNF